MFDLVSTVELTASAMAVLAVVVVLFCKTPRERALTISVALGWFGLVTALGATGVMHYSRVVSPAVLPLTIFGPALLLSALIWRMRSRVLDAPLALLVGVQAIRILGVSFVLLYAKAELPAPFAPIAGWGDILVGTLAIPLALTHPPRSVFAAWNILGIVDLLVAVGLGATSTPGPLRLFGTGEGSALMMSLPWILIPCFLVPTFLALHVATWLRLDHAHGRPRVVPAA